MPRKKTKSKKKSNYRSKKKTRRKKISKKVQDKIWYQKLQTSQRYHYRPKKSKTKLNP